jgi:hypothetical protein
MTKKSKIKLFFKILTVVATVVLHVKILKVIDVELIDKLILVPMFIFVDLLLVAVIIRM